MKKLLTALLLLISYTSFSQVRFWIGGTKDTVNVGHLAVYNYAFYDTIPTEITPKGIPSWQNIKDSTIYARPYDFGAIPNDGIDDVQAIQACTDYLHSKGGGKMIFFPVGEYTWGTRDSVYLRSNISYDGWGSTVVQTDSFTKLFFADTVRNVEITGFKARGVGWDYRGISEILSKRSAFVFLSYPLPNGGYYSENVSIHHNDVRNFGYAGIYTHHVNGIWIYNNRIRGVGHRIAPGGNWNFGIDMSDSTINAFVYNNLIDSCAQGVLATSNTFAFNICYNRIYDNIGQHGIYVTCSKNSKINNNVLVNGYGDGILDQAAVQNNMASENVEISNNTIVNFTSYGILSYNLDDVNHTRRNYNISNNIIYGGTTNVGAGMSIGQTDRLQANNNQVFGYANALNLTGISNSTISNFKSWNSYQSGIVVYGASNNTTFRDIEIYEPGLDNISVNNWGFVHYDGSNITIDNLTIRDTNNTMPYSFIDQSSTQKTLSIKNSTFYNGAVRFMADSILEYSNNLNYGTYFNSPSYIKASRLSINGIRPDVNNSITVPAVTELTGSQGVTVSGTTTVNVGLGNITPTSISTGGTVRMGNTEFDGGSNRMNHPSPGFYTDGFVAPLQLNAASVKINDVSGGNLFLGGVPNDATPDSVLTLVNGIVSRTAIFNLPIVSASSATSLSYGRDYVFTGTTATFTLPAVTSVSGRTQMITIKNRGSGNLTINSNSGGNDIYESSAVNTLVLSAGDAVILMPDGTYFNVE